jgi:uncharacterized membrane protein SpoIIM required for sporulation
MLSCEHAVGAEHTLSIIITTIVILRLILYVTTIPKLVMSICDSSLFNYYLDHFMGYR